MFFCFNGEQHFSDSPGTPGKHVFLYVHTIHVGVESLPEHRTFLPLLHIV